MQKKALSVILGGLLLISALAFVATPILADGNGGTTGNGDGNSPWPEGGGEKPTNPGGQMSDSMYQLGVDRSLMGKMAYSYGHGQGGFIFYDLNEENGVITDYGLITSDGDKVILSSIVVEGSTPDDIETHGSIARIIDQTTMAVLHDNPTGMYHLFVNASTNVTITLAGDMVVMEQNVMNDSCDLTYQLVISDGETSGMIASDAPFTVTENGTVIDCIVTDDLLIRFLPQVAYRQNVMEQIMMQAIQDGTVAAEISLMADENGGIYDTVSYRNELQIQVDQVVKNKFQLTAQGQNGQGALLLIHTETGTMDMVKDQLRVRLNDQDLKQVDDPMELIYGQPDEACYSVVGDGDTQQLLVYLPENTLGSVTVESVDALSDLLSPTGLAIMIGALALVAIAGVVAFRKR